MELTNLNAKQLKQVISEASSALNRRQKVEKAMIEIERVAKKYKLSKDELKTLLVSVQSSKAVSTSKPKSGRAKVEPKYQSQDGSKKWTGRRVDISVGAELGKFAGPERGRPWLTLL